MLIRKSFWRVAGIVLLAGVGAVATYLYPHSRSPLAARLGSQTLCARYSGLPVDWKINRLAGMVRVKGGEFVEGTTLGYEDERQEVRVKVKDFWIDQTEVTVAQFAAFVKATGYVTEAEREGGAVVFHKPAPEELGRKAYSWWSYVKGADWRHPTGPGSSPVDNQPVTLVTLSDARAYAQWLGRDLPSEAQWEYAAKAGHQGADLEKEPRDPAGKPIANFWQGKFPTSNSVEDGHEGLAPVGCYAANDFQLYDMIGNAWEQTRDEYTGPHQPAAGGNLPVPAGTDFVKPDRPMVIKGGSHLCGQDFCVRFRASAREAHEANLAMSHIGFRTVLAD